MARRTKRPLSGGKKALLALCVIALLIALFFLSYWITTISLRAGRGDSDVPAQPTASPTASPTVNYESLSKAELIELLKERDARIKELEGTGELGTGSGLITEITPSASPSASPTASPTPAPSVSPSASPSTKPSATPTQKPTQKPTQTPTQTPTQKPTQTPTPTPTQTPTPTPVPTKTPTSIRPVAPAA